MNIIIIEDELRTARALSSILKEIQPAIQILGILSSVQAAVDYFRNDTDVDLIFMDILLSDGHSFDIFEEISIHQPIIFCTAYNDYMTEAFKVNGIDYILKPFNKEAISHALDKWQNLQQHFINTNAAPLADKQPQKLIAGHNSSMLVFDNHCYRLLPFDEIAYFQIIGGLPAIKTFEGKTIFTEQSLAALMPLLPEGDFYRINRQYIVQKKAIKSVRPTYIRNLEIELKVQVDTKLIINKNKRTAFLSWLKQEPLKK